MPFDRQRLPDALGYYEAQGLNILRGKGAWRAANCPFCQSKDNFNINLESGGFHCWGCAARGGDVLAFHMAHAGVDFVDACKALGCWVDDGSATPARQRPSQLSARDALALVADDIHFAAVAAANVAYGVALTDADRQELLAAAARINHIKEVAL